MSKIHCYFDMLNSHSQKAKFRKSFSIPFAIRDLFFCGLLLSPLCANADAPTPLQEKEIKHIPARELILPEASMPMPFKITVRGATKADTELLEKLRDQSNSIVGASLGISTLGIVEAYTLPGFFSGSLIAGAVILVPLAVTLGAMEKNQQEAVEQALQKLSLIDLSRVELQRKSVAWATLPQHAPTVELVILAYGLTHDPVCLFADAAVTVTMHDRVIFEDLIYIEPFIRSSDAPPPICISIEHFAKDNGKLILNGLIEYGQVIPAIVARRTKPLLWQE